MKLRRLSEDELSSAKAVGKVRSFTVRNPISDSDIYDYLKTNPQFKPKESNVYDITDFNPSAQFTNERNFYSVRSVQFYKI